MPHHRRGERGENLPPTSSLPKWLPWPGLQCRGPLPPGPQWILQFWALGCIHLQAPGTLHQLCQGLWASEGCLPPGEGSGTWVPANPVGRPSSKLVTFVQPTAGSSRCKTSLHLHLYNTNSAIPLSLPLKQTFQKEAAYSPEGTLHTEPRGQGILCGAFTAGQCLHPLPSKLLGMELPSHGPLASCPEVQEVQRGTEPPPGPCERQSINSGT